MAQLRLGDVVLHKKISRAVFSAMLLLATGGAAAQNAAPDQQSLDCRSYCAAPAGGAATLYVSWPSLKKPDTHYRLYLSSGADALDAKSDGLVIDMIRRAQKVQKLSSGYNKLPKAGANWKVKSKPFSAAGLFTDLKIGHVEEFNAPRGRNRANYAIAIDGLDPQTSYYLQLEAFKAKSPAGSLEAYCVVTTCPGHDEGAND